MEHKLLEMNETRPCPKCGRALTYSRRSKLLRAIRDNSTCVPCWLDKMHDMNRVVLHNNTSKPCPKCNKKIVFGDKYHYERSIKSGSLCLSCAKKGDKNPAHGKPMTGITPSYNAMACDYMDSLTAFNFKHALNGGEYYVEKLGYFLDGYDKERNLAFEFDEWHHFDSKGCLKKRDITRMRRIQGVLKCDFLRYHEPFNTLQWHISSHTGLIPMDQRPRPKIRCSLFETA